MPAKFAHEPFRIGAKYSGISGAACSKFYTELHSDLVFYSFTDLPNGIARSGPDVVRRKPGLSWKLESEYVGFRDV